MRPSGWAYRGSQDGGASTLEALIAISILGLALSALVVAFSASSKTSAKTSSTISEAVKALSLDEYIRSTALRIRIPYWDSMARVNFIDGGVAIPYLDGMKKDILSLAAEDSSIKFALNAESRTFTGAYLLSISVVPENAESPRGISVEYSIGDNSYITLANFGSWAIEGSSP